MQEQRPFPPPFGLVKGYPFARIDSKYFMNPHRNTFEIGEDGICYDESKFPRGDEDAYSVIIDILDDALGIAEQQLEDIFEEKPFIPQSFGFVPYEKKELANSNPITFYVSKFNERIILHRIFESHLWALKIYPNTDSYFRKKPTELKLDFPCQRIAFAFFYAMNIQVEEPEVPELLEAPEVAVTEEEK